MLRQRFRGERGCRLSSCRRSPAATASTSRRGCRPRKRSCARSASLGAPWVTGSRRPVRRAYWERLRRVGQGRRPDDADTFVGAAPRGPSWSILAAIPRPADESSGGRRASPGARMPRTPSTETLSQLRSATYAEPTKQTLGEFLEEWLAARRSQLRPSTHASYELILRTYVIPRIGGRRLQEITPALLNAPLRRAALGWSVQDRRPPVARHGARRGGGHASRVPRRDPLAQASSAIRQPTRTPRSSRDAAVTPDRRGAPRSCAGSLRRRRATRSIRCG